MSGNVTNLMNQQKPKVASKEDKVRFWNLFASLPKWRVHAEFDRQTQKMNNQLRIKEIHHEDQRKINKIIEDNPGLTVDDATNIYYDSKEMAKPTIQYQRGNFLVADDEFKNLTTYMHDLHEYYMAEATETDQKGFEVIIHHPLVFQYPHEEKHFVG